ALLREQAPSRFATLLNAWFEGSGCEG
ncbi:MAG: hypothetical protein H6Q89_3440, partial [Myxococcaceae bacterium]|nr:hypothetical protein [Myxococcaceae bacterium]